MKLSSFSLGLVFTLLVFGCGDDSNPTSSCSNDVACDDGNPCTINACNSETQSCETNPVSDGGSCLVAQMPGACRDGTCFSITCDDVDCDDGNPCTADSCDPIRVVCASAPLADATACDLDGAPATCEAGICRALTCDDLVCDDGNSCTTHSCDPVEVECASSAVPDQTICGEVGAFGMCDAGICDLSQTAESGTFKLSVAFVGAPAGTAIYEADCEGATLLSGVFIPVDGVWEAFIALPVGMCTLDAILLVNGEVSCRVGTSLDVAAGYGGEISSSASCPQ